MLHNHLPVHIAKPERQNFYLITTPTIWNVVMQLYPCVYML